MKRDLDKIAVVLNSRRPLIFEVHRPYHNSPKCSDINLISQVFLYLCYEVDIMVACILAPKDSLSCQFRGRKHHFERLKATNFGAILCKCGWLTWSDPAKELIQHGLGQLSLFQAACEYVLPYPYHPAFHHGRWCVFLKACIETFHQIRSAI